MTDAIDSMEVEEWRDVIGWEGLYQVSSHGRVMSLPRDVRCRGGGVARKKGRVLSQKATHCGYMQVCIRHAATGRNLTVYVHKLVTSAFIGPRPEKAQVNHINNIRSCNRAYNLEYLTAKENCQHRRVHGTFPIGENNGRARLTSEQVSEIRSRRRAGEKLKELGANYGVHKNTIWWITSGKTWVD